ncbi:MAG: ATP-binding cassette domain-containing protein [Bacteroidales bacterium]|nr:ATP-binding cassette domain-containing protein [Bacteroidales bacterium]
MSTNINTTPLVAVEHLSHRYSKDWAIYDINLELGGSKIVGLLGSNGAGKSTMMNIICGVLTQTEGRVLINGYDINRQSVEAKRQIGFLPQKPPLHTDLTVEEYLEYSANLRLIDKKKIKRSIEEAMYKCDITHFRKRLIKNLSGGYQQRVGIAQSIIHNPKFIVLDEPTNGLDPNQILEIRNLIKEISQDKVVLLSTHILQEVQAMCDDIIMIELGKFVFKGTMQEFSNSLTSNVLILTFGSLPDLSEIRSIPGVIDIEQFNDKSIKLHYDLQHDIQPLLISESVSRGWQLNEIYKEKVNTDEIFKHFSKDAYQKKEKIKAVNS